MNLTEQQLALRLLRLLRQHDDVQNNVARYHAEVVLPDKSIADLVLISPDLGGEHAPLTTIFETKVRKPDDLLRQCVNRKDWADIVYAAMPPGFIGVVPPTTGGQLDAFRLEGIGFVVVGVHELHYVLPAAPRYGHHEILKHCNNHNAVGGIFATAGSTGRDKRATAFNINLAEVIAQVRDGIGIMTAAKVAKLLGISRGALLGKIRRRELPFTASVVQGITYIAVSPKVEVANV